MFKHAQSSYFLLELYIFIQPTLWCDICSTSLTLDTVYKWSLIGYGWEILNSTCWLCCLSVPLHAVMCRKLPGEPQILCYHFHIHECIITYFCNLCHTVYFRKIIFILRRNLKMNLNLMKIMQSMNETIKQLFLPFDHDGWIHRNFQSFFRPILKFLTKTVSCVWS